MSGARWTPEEDALVREQVGARSFKQIARRLGRSERSVESRLQRTCGSIYDRQVGNLLTSTVIAGTLGVRLKLISERMGDGRIAARSVMLKRRRVYVATKLAVQTFVLSGGLINLQCSPVATWQSFVDEGAWRWGERAITAPRLLTILIQSKSTIERLQHGSGFPTSILAASPGGPSWYSRADVALWLDAHPSYWTNAAREELQRT